MVRAAVERYLCGQWSRREFVAALVATGVALPMATALANEVAGPLAPEVVLRHASGGKVTCETLRLWGVTHVFGNTGSYEAGFLDALVAYEDIRYVLGLHEGAVVAMADGYARVSGKPGVVNVHAIAGTANALGMIVNAWADSSALVITVGLNPHRSENLGVFTDTTGIEAITGQYAKLAFTSTRGDTLAESLRRAFVLATVLPSAPVFLGVSADVWTEPIPETTLIAPQRSVHPQRAPAAQAELERLAQWLTEAENPLLIAGAELPRWGGIAELVELADLLGANVSGDTAASRSSMGFPSSHPRYLGVLRTPLAADAEFDLIVLAGASRLSLAQSVPPLIPYHARIAEFGLREDHLARAHPADLVLYAHPQAVLRQLLDLMRAAPPAAARIGARATLAAERAAQRRDRLHTQLAGVASAFPIAPARLVAELDTALAGDAIVVTEGVSSDAVIWDYLQFDQAGRGRQHLISSGGTLGWALGAGIGAKLAAPARQVVVLLGDGSFQFGLQALWTARRQRIGITVVIFNNHGYQANRWALAGLDGHAARSGHYIGVHLTDPDIDHVGMARGYGLDGERVERAANLASALRRGLEAQARGEGYVIDVRIAATGAGAEATWLEPRAV